MATKDYSRKGPLPPNHPLAGGRTIIYGVNPPAKRVEMKSTTSAKDKAQISALGEWNALQMGRDIAGLERHTDEEFREFMTQKQKEYDESLKGEKSESKTGEEGEVNSDSGAAPEAEPDQRDTDAGGVGPDLYREDTDSSSGGTSVPDPSVSSTGVPAVDGREGEGGAQ